MSIIKCITYINPRDNTRYTLITANILDSSIIINIDLIIDNIPLANVHIVTSNVFICGIVISSYIVSNITNM